MPLVTGDQDGGYVARLAFTAGVKHDGRYWQGRLPGPYNPPVLSDRVLDTLDSFSECLS